MILMVLNDTDLVGVEGTLTYIQLSFYSEILNMYDLLH